MGTGDGVNMQAGIGMHGGEKKRKKKRGVEHAGREGEREGGFSMYTARRGQDSSAGKAPNS